MKKRKWNIFGDRTDFDFWVALLLNGRTVPNGEKDKKHKNPPEKIIPQNYDYDCGFGMFCTGMLMIGREDVLKTNLYERLEVNPVDGTKSENIKKVLEEESIQYIEMFEAKMEDLETLVRGEGFAFVSYQSEGTSEEIERLECEHYSIVFDMDDESIWLIDPSYDEELEPGFGKGVVRLMRDDFEKKWIDKGIDGTIYEKWLIGLKGAKND